MLRQFCPGEKLFVYPLDRRLVGLQSQSGKSLHFTRIQPQYSIPYPVTLLTATLSHTEPLYTANSLNTLSYIASLFYLTNVICHLPQVQRVPLKPAHLHGEIKNGFRLFSFR